MRTICSREEDLICKNCVYSEPTGDNDNFSLCNVKNDTMGELVRDDSFCGEGSWALEATTENWHYDKEGDKRVTDPPTKRIKVIDREYAIAVILNQGILDW